MNRRRDEPRTPVSVFIAVILAAAISAAGGVLHAYYKNQQVKTSREIDAIDRNIEHCRLEIRTTEMRMDQLLNRFVIRKQLEENGSSLRPISLSVVEEIDSAPPSRRSVASTAR
jgi:cell division protein FtsL